jgi:hypothetical protein
MLLALCYLVQNGLGIYDDSTESRSPGWSASPTWWEENRRCR